MLRVVGFWLVCSSSHMIHPHYSHASLSSQLDQTLNRVPLLLSHSTNHLHMPRNKEWRLSPNIDSNTVNTLAMLTLHNQPLIYSWSKRTVTRPNKPKIRQWLLTANLRLPILGPTANKNISCPLNPNGRSVSIIYRKTRSIPLVLLLVHHP